MEKSRQFICIGMLSLVGLIPLSAQAEETVSRSPWSIQEAVYAGEVNGEGILLTAELTVQVLRDGFQEIPLSFSNAAITELKITGGSANLVAQGNQYAVVVRKRGTYRLTAKLVARLTRDDQYEGIRMGIPQALFSTVRLIIPRTDIELSPEHVLMVTKETQKDKVIVTASLGLSREISLRWAVRPMKPVNQTPVEPVSMAEVRILGTLEEETLRIIGLINLHVLEGELKTLVLDLPSGLVVSTVRGVQIDDWKVVSIDGSQRLTVMFGQPLKVGATELIVEAEQPIGPPDGQVILPSLVPLGMKRLTGTLAIANGTSIEIENPVLEGLHRIDVREIPPDLVRLSIFPVVAGFRYQQIPYRATVSLHRPEELAVLVAIAESGELATLVTPTGEIITRVVYQVRNNKKGSLGVTLPKGATLWSALVNRRAVKPAAGPNGQILIPLAVTVGPESTFPVEVVYVEKADPFSWIGQAKYQGPVLDIPVTVARWILFLPEQIQGVRFTGNLQRNLIVAGFLPEFQPLRQQVEADKAYSRGNENQRVLDKHFMGASFRERLKPEAMEVDRVEKDFSNAVAKVQQTGVLPFRIAIPHSGRPYVFGKLLVAGDPLTIQVRYLKTPIPTLLSGGIGLLGFLGLGSGFRTSRRRQSVRQAGSEPNNRL